MLYDAIIHERYISTVCDDDQREITMDTTIQDSPVTCEYCDDTRVEQEEDGDDDDELSSSKLLLLIRPEEKRKKRRTG